MEIKYGHGLEFDVDAGRQESSAALTLEEETALQQIIRQGFRAPVGLSEQMRLTIAGVAYAVFNLSGSGVGIYLDEPGQLEEQGQLQGMSFTINGQTFLVDGTVVHLSNDGVQDLCGIELTAMPPECQEAILTYLQKSRNALFVV